MIQRPEPFFYKNAEPLWDDVFDIVAPRWLGPQDTLVVPGWSWYSLPARLAEIDYDYLAKRYFQSLGIPKGFIK